MSRSSLSFLTTLAAGMLALRVAACSSSESATPVDPNGGVPAREGRSPAPGGALADGPVADAEVLVQAQVASGATEAAATFVECIPSEPYPQSLGSPDISPVKMGEATYLYASFDKGFDDPGGFQTFRYVVRDGPGCNLARDTSWSDTGVVESTETPAGVDPTGGVWVLADGPGMLSGLARIYPGPRLTCTFDPMFAYGQVRAGVTFDDTGTSALAGIVLSNDGIGYGKVTVNGDSCTVVPFPILLDADRKRLIGSAINGQGDFVFLNEDVPGRIWFFGPDATYQKTAVVGIDPDRITRCRAGLCVYGRNGDSSSNGVFFCDDDVTHCGWAPVPDDTHASGNLLRGSKATPTFLTRTEFAPARPSTEHLIYRAPD